MDEVIVDVQKVKPGSDLIGPAQEVARMNWSTTGDRVQVRAGYEFERELLVDRVSVFSLNEVRVRRQRNPVG